MPFTKYIATSISIRVSAYVTHKYMRVTVLAVQYTLNADYEHCLIDMYLCVLRAAPAYMYHSNMNTV
eukprot:9992-Heterococcus_DN1.PRE.2